MKGAKVFLVGLVVALVGLFLGGSASAQEPTMAATPSSVPEPGTYDFEVTGSGFTEPGAYFAVCNTGDPDEVFRMIDISEHCEDDFGELVPLEGGSYSTTVEDVEVTADGVTFLLFVPYVGGERSHVSVNIGEPMDDQLAATGTDTSLLVILGTGIALSGVMVLGLSRRLRTEAAKRVTS